MVHDHARVEKIRRRAEAKLESLEKLHGKSNAPEFLSQFRLALHWLSDLEHLFLADLSRNARSAEEESRWLSWAEEFLSMGDKQAAAAEELFEALSRGILRVHATATRSGIDENH